MAEKTPKQVSPSESIFLGTSDRTVWKIVLAAFIFHVAIAATIYAVNKIKIVKEPEMIPVFELVNVAAPASVPAAPPPPPPQTETPPPPEPPPPEPPKPKVEQPRPVPKPVVKPELPPEPKIAPEPPKEVVKEEPVKETPPEPVAEPEQVAEPEPTPEPPKKDFDIDDMAMPTTFEKSSLATVGSVNIDPLLQAFLERLKQLVMQNFNPPNGLTIPREAKTTVQFVVNSDGSIENVILKKSSGNKTWDALSVRAVQVTKGPGLPATYKADALSLQFNFTPN